MTNPLKERLNLADAECENRLTPRWLDYNDMSAMLKRIATPDPALVDAGAKALWLADREDKFAHASKWEYCPERQRDFYRNAFKAALAALAAELVT